jgi:uncharacterized protein (TIGR00369 family)
MIKTTSINNWAEEQIQARNKIMSAGGKPGFASPDQLKVLSGKALLEGMMSGDLPHPYMNESLGFDLMEVGEGRAVFQGVPSMLYFNPMGTVHGGWFSTLLDSAMGCAVHSTLPAGRTYTTAELSINFVRPATHKSGPLRAVGNVIHAGRKMTTAEAKVLDESGRLYAHATTTCFVFDLPASL